MRIFVTGGSGFVGGAAIQKLSKDHDIRAMSRSEKGDAVITALGAEPVRCDLENVTADHMADCDIVIHSAAFVEEWGSWKIFETFNITGTQKMLSAAKEAGVKRFIHIGTEAALFHGQHMRNVDEHYPLAPQSPFPYSSTKARAEMLVRDANDASADFNTLILRPRMIWGPGDQTILAAVKTMAAAGKFTWIDGGQAMTSTTHIANLTHAISLAFTKGGEGEAYFVLDDGPISTREFLSQYLATQDIDLGDKDAPGGLIRGLANIIEPIWRLFGIKSPPPITRFTAHIMSRDCILIDRKARAELGYAPVISRAEGFAALSS